MPGQKEIVVVPRSLNALPSSFTGSLSIDPGSSFVPRGALGVSEESSPSGKPSMIDKVRTVPHPLAFEAYALGWVVTKDSLLSEDIAA